MFYSEIIIRKIAGMHTIHFHLTSCKNRCNLRVSSAAANTLNSQLNNYYDDRIIIITKIYKAHM